VFIVPGFVKMRMWLKDAETKVGIDEEKDTWMEP